MKSVNLIIAAVNPNKYNHFDIRATKPIYYTDYEDSSGAVVESTKEIKVGNNKNNITHILPNPIAIQLSIVDKSINTIKENKAFRTIESNSNILKEKIYQDSKIIYDHIELVQTSIVFGYTALETFTNLSIPHDYNHEIINNKGITEIYNKENIERWLSLKDKISIVLVDIYNTKNIKKHPIWQSFLNFEKYRHEIIHQKSIDSFNYYEKYFNPKTVQDLNTPKNLISWFYEQVELKGKTNPIWPWINSSNNSIPTRYDAKDFFSKTKIVGNLCDGFK